MEFYRASDCVDYVGSDPKIPALPMELAEPLHGYRVSLTAPVDTGFAGYILVDRATYERLRTAELPKQNFGIYQTMVGPVVLRRSRVVVQLAKKEFESYIETPLYGVGKVLVGRRILSKMNLAMLGTNGRCCHLKQERAEQAS